MTSTSTHVELVLASGAVASVVTKPDGTAVFELPAEEPERGFVKARAGGTAMSID